MQSRVVKIAESLTILSKYENSRLDADHDILYAGPTPDTGCSEEDAKRLEKLGWSLDESLPAWTFFT